VTKNGSVRCIARGAAVVALTASLPGLAHHSFAMYDEKKTYVFTGVVTRISPDANHLQIFLSPLNEARAAVVRDDGGRPVIWAIELRAAGQVALEGVTVEAFPPGTIMSIGLHPLRNGLPAGGRGKSGLFKCPVRTPPAPGQHCDSVAGSTSHGQVALPMATERWAP
jgi:hypothetical protein